MIQIPIERIVADDIQRLVDNGVRESGSIEFKRELPAGTDAEKKEFLADVSSFANAGGGDIIYGIQATEGVATSVSGLTNFNEDNERLRLESLIRDGLEPRVPGVRLHAVRLADDMAVLILRVPKSWVGPHMVTYKGSSRFFSRASAGKFPMDLPELRAAFDASSEIPKKIKAWRDERLGTILADSGPARLNANGILVAHLVPLGSFADPWRFSVEELRHKNLHFPPLCESDLDFDCNCDRNVNLDGLLTFVPPHDKAGRVSGYAQVFRSGAIEAVYAELTQDRDGQRTIESPWIENEVVKSLRTYLDSYIELEVAPPFVFMLSALQVRGALLFNRINRNPRSIDRDVLCFPDIVIDDVSVDLPQALRPVFDSIWNACGLSRNLNYDQEGRWKPL